MVPDRTMPRPLGLESRRAPDPATARSHPDRDVSETSSAVHDFDADRLGEEPDYVVDVGVLQIEVD